MSNASEQTTGRAELIGLILAISIPAGLIALWASPRPAVPTEMPALVLPADEVARDIAAQDALAARAVDDEDEVHRRELYLAYGLAEVRMNDLQSEMASRSAQLVRLAHVIGQRDEALGVSAIRARDVSRVMPTLRDEGHHLGAIERASELGAFPAGLQRYGAIVNGRRVAPELVIRASFLARWNGIHGIPLIDGMTQLERRAYFGWLALEGGVAPLEMRARALEEYAEAGGTRVWEARAVLAFEGGELAASRAAFEHACDLTGSLRLRNHAIAAERAALEVDSTE